jgi:hypothetical protein
MCSVESARTRPAVGLTVKLTPRQMKQPRYGNELSATGSSPDGPQVSRWFISAPGGANLGPLIDGLRRRGAEPYVLSDVAPLGASILQSVQQAIVRADRVLVVLSDEGMPTSLFEAGVAVGLGKPVVVVAEPQMRLPEGLSGFLTIRARPDDLDAINFALDQAEGRSEFVISRRRVPASGTALGGRADELLERLSAAGPTVTEQVAIDVLVEAIEGSGAVAVQGVGRDRHFDLGVWSDDLDAIAANPLLVEVKRSFRVESVHQAFAALGVSSNARFALIVYLDTAVATSDAMKVAHIPVLAVSLRDLLARMRTSSFAAVVRDLRNRSAHGIWEP